MMSNNKVKVNVKNKCILLIKLRLLMLYLGLACAIQINEAFVVGILIQKLVIQEPKVIFGFNNYLWYKSNKIILCH